MTALQLSGKEPYETILKNLKMQISEEKLDPRLDIIKIGYNKESEIYVKHKETAGKKIGIDVQIHQIDENENQRQIEDVIKKLNLIKNNGIIVQLPIPKHLDAVKLINLIEPKKDVDGITAYNLGMLMHNLGHHVPCTPLGIMKLLEYYKIEVTGKNVCIINRSIIVGKPLFTLMLNANATPTLCHSKTINLNQFTKNADIIVTAIGKPRFFGLDYFTNNSIIIDVGINRLPNGTICGDVDYQAVFEHVKAITPVPGGIGKMTVAMLLQNVVNAAKDQRI